MTSCSLRSASEPGQAAKAAPPPSFRTEVTRRAVTLGVKPEDLERALIIGQIAGLLAKQATPQDAVNWQATRLTGEKALAVRASTKLRGDDLLVITLAGTSLRTELDRLDRMLWRGANHVSIRQLTEDFACYVYLPRLKGSSVLLDAIRDGLGLFTWQQDSFAYADSFDEAAGRYRGLRLGGKAGRNLL